MSKQGKTHREDGIGTHRLEKETDIESTGITEELGGNDLLMASMATDGERTAGKWQNGTPGIRGCYWRWRRDEKDSEAAAREGQVRRSQ